jgi:Aspartyl protease
MSSQVRRSDSKVPPKAVITGDRLLRALLVFLLSHALAPTPASAQPKIVRVPFRTVQSMILVEGKANGDTLTFLLDTGSIGTIVSTRMYHSHYPLHRVRRSTDGPGIIGESISTRMDLELGGHRWYAQRVSIMNLDELSEILRVKHIDGLIGQDVLREFRAVRIDYHAHVIELEE